MFDIYFNFDDISISSIESSDIDSVKEWLEAQKCNGNTSEQYLNIDEFRERFIESYVSETEFFVKINKEEKLIGIIKGRIEFKQNNEVWIWCYVIDNSMKNKDLGNRLVTNLTSYFNREFGIYNFFTICAEDNEDTKEFWRNNGFKLIRIAENYFDNNGQKVDMLIYKMEK